MKNAWYTGIRVMMIQKAGHHAFFYEACGGFPLNRREKTQWLHEAVED